jgi:Icc-related predicted phosphoesterase
MSHEKLRLWFFTDIHGSNECFRKFLSTLKNPNKPNVLIIGGDITGKQVVALVEDEDGTITARIEGKQLAFALSDVSRVKRRLSDLGYYVYECDEQGYRQMLFDSNTHDNIMERLAGERLEEWVKLADESLPSRDVCQVFVNAGNDDPLFVDAILDKSRTLIRPEGRVFELPCGFKLLSTGLSSPTPWKCPRDVSEKDIAARISQMTAQLSSHDRRRSIFNFHCPPRDTALDLAFKIDPVTLRPYAGFKGVQREHVGSHEVRRAIEVWGPLVGLHGHIHEVTAKERIGQTICFNPGSDYRTGHLQGVFLQINLSGKVEADIFTQERDPDQGRARPLTWVESIVSALPLIGEWFEAYQAASHRREMRDKVDHVGQKMDALLEKIDSLAKAVPPASHPSQIKPDQGGACDDQRD